MRKRQGAILSLMGKVGAVPIGSGSPAAVDAAPAEKPQPAAPSSRPKPTPQTVEPAPKDELPENVTVDDEEEDDDEE